jgi:ABC-type transport system involved in multi-copper enzyme maturation permease subunit
MNWTVTDAVLVGVRAAIVLAFLAFGWRDLLMLFRRPAKNMGTGLNRAWSVGRTTMLEAWAGRVWLLPILWLFSSVILIAVVRPFDETERMPLNIRMLLSGQEMLLLVMMWVMACLSLPRERERKIVVTNASKPLSRLEIVLGKMIGFWAVAGVMVLVMGLASWGILNLEDWRVRRQAKEAYQIQEKDYTGKGASVQAGGGGAPPSEAAKRLSEEGSLFAYNFVTVRKGNMSVVGDFDPTKSPPVRYLKGGSTEKAVYRFGPRLMAAGAQVVGPVGARPWFLLQFPYEILTPDAPREIQLRVVATRVGRHQGVPPIPQEKVVTLNPAGFAQWEPDDPLELCSFVAPDGTLQDQGEVTVEVSCPTRGVYLQVIEGADPDAQGNLPPNTDFNVLFIPDRQDQRLQPPAAHPVMRGFERRGLQEISGPRRTDVVLGNKIPLESGIFRFSGADLRNVPVDDQGRFTLAMILETSKTDNAELPTQIGLRVQSMDQLGDDPFVQTMEVTEKRRMTVPIPAKFLGDPDPTQRGDLLVSITCQTWGHGVAFGEESVRIEKPQTAFVLNLFKSELVILLEAVVLIAICVTCSVRVGWPVAMLLSCVCALFGFFVEFIAGLSEGGGLAALNYRGSGPQSATFQFFDTFTGGIWKILGVISSFVPNFTIYRPQEFITNLQNIPGEVVLSNVVWTVVFVLPVIAIGYLLFRKQELG